MTPHTALLASQTGNEWKQQQANGRMVPEWIGMSRPLALTVGQDSKQIMLITFVFSMLLVGDNTRYLQLWIRFKID